MKLLWTGLLGLVGLLSVASLPTIGLAATILGGEVYQDQEQVYPEGASLDAVITDMTSSQKWNKVTQWMHAHSFRRISGNLASHNVTSNGGTTRTSMVPFKNDATHHGAIAVEGRIVASNGQTTEAWLIWEFWKAGDTVEGNTYVLNGNNFDPDTQMNRSFSQFANCVTLGCGTAAGGCFIGNIIDAEAGFAPCYVAWCGGTIGACGLWALFG